MRYSNAPRNGARSVFAQTKGPAGPKPVGFEGGLDMRGNEKSAASNLNFRPSLELLSGRECPSTTASAGGGMLFISGDNASDTVSVSINGNQVTVTSSQGTQTFAGIHSVA